MPRCPSCFVPMIRIEEDGIKSCSCGNCFGSWINALGLLRRVRLDAERAVENGPALGNQASIEELAEVVGTSDSKKPLRCPQCEKLMNKEQFHPMVPVGLDRCRKCGYFWLDAGEMALLRRLHVELMTSDDPELQRRREKVATAMAAWEGRPTLESEMRRAGDDLEDGFDLLGYLLNGM